MENEGEKLNRLEKLENKLYSIKNEGIRQTRSAFHVVKKEIPTSWQEVKEEIPENHHVAKTSKFFKKLFFISAGFLLVAMLVATYSIFFGNGGVSNDNVDIKILGSTFTNGGETLSLSVEVVNRNPVPLELADLLIEYPKGAGDNGEMVRVRKSIGEIRSGESVSDSEDVVLFGEIGSTKYIKASVEYRLSDSNAIFVKETTFAVTINSSPISLSVDGSSTTVSGQDMSFDIDIKSSSKEVIKNVLVKVEYPFGFTFESSAPEPSYNNSVFYLGDLEPGDEKKITLNGVLSGGDNETRAFRIYVGEQNAVSQTEISTMYNSILKTFTISRPFLDARIVYGGTIQENYDVVPNQTLPMQIIWSNNLPVDITDAQIIATFSGNAMDLSSLKAQTGFYNSNTGELIWSKDTVSSFAKLAPGANGDLSLSFKSLPLYTTGKGVLTNPTITVSVSVKGNQYSTGQLGNQANSIATTTFKVSSDFQVSAKATYNDGPFTNTGPLPPKAGTETTYTITWTATNSSNALTDAYVKATLPLYVSWKNIVSPDGSDLTYNEATREVRWNIGALSPGVGYGSSPKTVSFQVGLTPSTSQVGSSPELMSESTSSSFDTFVGAVLNRKWSSISTKLSSDSGYSSSNSSVVE